MMTDILLKVNIPMIYVKLIIFFINSEDDKIFQMIDNDLFLQRIGIDEIKIRLKIINEIWKNAEVFHIQNINEKRRLITKEFQNWSASDVSFWLQSLEMNIYFSNFINLKEFKFEKLDEKTLFSLGVVPLGHRKKIMRSISSLDKIHHQISSLSCIK